MAQELTGISALNPLVPVWCWPNSSFFGSVLFECREARLTRSSFYVCFCSLLTFLSLGMAVGVAVERLPFFYSVPVPDGLDLFSCKRDFDVDTCGESFLWLGVHKFCGVLGGCFLGFQLVALGKSWWLSLKFTLFDCRRSGGYVLCRRELSCGDFWYLDDIFVVIGCSFDFGLMLLDYLKSYASFIVLRKEINCSLLVSVMPTGFHSIICGNGHPELRDLKLFGGDCWACRVYLLESIFWMLHVFFSRILISLIATGCPLFRRFHMKYHRARVRF